MSVDVASLLLKDGIVTGSIFVLLAVASIMTFAVTRVVFLPQGDLISYAALTLSTFQAKEMPGTAWLIVGGGVICFVLDLVSGWRLKRMSGIGRSAAIFLGWPIVATALSWIYVPFGGANLLADVALTLALVIPLGPIIYRLAFQPVQNASVLTLLIIAVAVHYGLISLSEYIYGSEGYTAPPFIGGALTIGVVRVTGQNMLVFGSSLVLVTLLAWFFARTGMGRALRATAVNRTGARLVGISPRAAGMFAFTLTAVIGALSGVLIAPMTIIYYDTGFLLGLFGLIGAVIGGMANYPVAAIGALALGIVGSFASYWMSELKDAIVLLLIVPLLVWLSVRSGGDSEQEDLT